MRGINQVTLLGNIGNDPEIRSTNSGKSVANFSIATTESWADAQSGEKKERTDWHRISCYGRLAEIAGEYLHKGDLVCVLGAIQYRTYTDKDGQERHNTNIIVHELRTLGKRQRSNSDTALPASERRPPATASADAPPRDEDGENFPF